MKREAHSADMLTTHAYTMHVACVHVCINCHCYYLSKWHYKNHRQMAKLKITSSKMAVRVAVVLE